MCDVWELTAPSSEGQAGNHKHTQCRQPETDGGNDNKRMRMRMMAEREDPPAVDSAPLKSKEYIAESAEHIYRTHTCPTCRRCFKLRSHLQEHLHLHFPDPSLQCSTCKRYFTSKSKLRIHRLREAGEKVHRCHLCEYSAVEQNAIRRHIISMHADAAQNSINGQSYPCPTCGQSFHQSRSLKAHMKMHNKMTASKPVVCFKEACSFQSSVRKELLRHTVEVHGVKAVECRYHACGAIFQKEADMEIHYRTHLAYHCSQCDFSCSNKALFLQHQRHGHAGTNQLACEFCSYVTFNPVEFEQHLEHLHANEKIYRCSQCTYTTSHKRGLKRHTLMHSGEKPHKCSLCDFRCRDESYLSKHMLTHSDDKNFMCAECGYVTKWKHYLNVHMRKHAGDLRYQCDQCPYRCHRMDQLNSHKLRHQAKSLMCEICAYSCKRKCELRHHMLAKHSGEEKRTSVYQCKYCKYTTCYRQALKNHENCKHTKLTEFQCALCFYSSFSSVSLFMHKRKAHGYVPGDKKWLENYAAKEKERNSTKVMQDFYTELSSRQQQCEQSSEGQPAFQREQSELCGKQTLSKSLTTVEAVSVFDEVVHEVISESPPPVSSQEEYCTLILTTLPAAHYQTPSVQNAGENGADQTPPKMKTSDSCLKNVASSTFATSLEEDSAAMPQQELELSDKDDSDEPLDNTTSQSVEPTKVVSDNEKIRSILPHVQYQQLETEVRLNALKKHDKDQAEAMVLEGRVQMLVVPTKDVHRFEMRENNHRRTLCHGKKKEHQCEACGAQFKQQRSLHGHVAKKCLAVVREICQHADQSCSLATGGFPEVIDSNQPALSSQNPPTDSKHQEIHQQEEQACTSHSAVCKGFDDSGPASTELAHQPSTSQRIKPLKVQLVKKLLVPGTKDNRRLLQKKSLYTENDGRFKCKLCKFSSVRVATVERHVTACQNKYRRTGNLIFSGLDGECDHEKEALVDECTKGTQKKLADSNCVLKRCQKIALERHKKCMKKFDSTKATHLHCQQCKFTCKQKRCMAQHVALKHQGVRPHHCRYCPFATTRHYRLGEHESLHTGIGRHKCDACDKTFGAVTKLRQHKLRIHDKQPTQFCSLCDFSGYTLDDVRRHSFRCHTGVLKHACPDCDAGFSSGSALRNHCKRVHPLQVRFPCEHCDYTCSSEVTLRSHQQSKHRQESFPTKKHKETHQRSHPANQCQLCPFATKTRKLFAQHLLNDHEEGPPEDKPLKCSSCHFACRHQLVLEHHLRSHGGRRLYRCRDCEYSTRNKQKITWHVRIHTGEKPYSCEQCSYSCTDPSRLKLHMRVHQEEKKYLCPECGYKCKWATQLKYHMTKHTGEKPYACDDCDYRTNRADALRAHRDTQHCDLRPYVCEKCGKAFKTSFILKTHQRQHSDDRPYTCGLCHKAFRWPAGLRHHYLSHTKQQPFCCRHCSYRAKQRFQVVKHLQRHHPEMSVEQGVVRHSEAVSLTLKEALQGTLGVRAAEVEEEATVVAAAVAEELVQRGEDCETKGL